MQKLVFRNANGIELDLTSDPFGITEWEGFSADELNIQSQQVPFQDGGVFLDALLNQRELSVTVAMNDQNDLEKRYRLRREMISKLNPKLGEGVLIYTNDYLSKQIHCIPQLPVFQNKNSNDSGTPKVSCSFTACNPYWEDLEENIITINEYGEIINNGDVPAQVVIDIQEGSSNTTIRNQTTEKIIQLSGSFEDEIIINTNIGQKKAETRKIDFKWLSGGLFSSVASNGEKILYNGSQNFVEDRYTGKQTNTIILSKVKWLNNEFIGIRNNRVYSSEDGIIWTEYTTGTNDRINDINYLNGNYYVVTNDFEIYKSANKTEWTSVHDIENDRPLQCIDYLNNKYIAGGIGGWISVSSDGTNWTDYDSNSTGIQGWVHKIIYQDGKYYCASERGIFVSIDGLVYTAINGTTGVWLDLIYANNLFIAVGDNGKILTSGDGENWTQRESGTENRINCIIYSNNIFYLCGYGGMRGRSRNGKTWNIEQIGINTSGNIINIIDVEGLLYCGVSYGEIYKSRDGKDWELAYNVSGSYPDNVLYDIIYGNKKIIAITERKVVVSENGNTWQEYTVFPSATGTWAGSIAYSKKLNLYVVARREKSLWTSQDGINWTELQNVSSQRLSRVIYSEEQELFVAIGDAMVIMISENGVVWEQVSSGVTHSPSSIAYGNGKFVASYQYYASLQNHYGVLISTNGREWEDYPVSEHITTICFANNLFVSFGFVGNSKIYTSSDGINWKEADIDLENSMSCCIFFNNAYLCAGLIGVVVQSFEKDVENIIDKLTANTDMTFGLAQGKNNILVVDDNGKSIIIKFRQKYIGV